MQALNPGLNARPEKPAPRLNGQFKFHPQTNTTEGDHDEEYDGG